MKKSAPNPNWPLCLSETIHSKPCSGRPNSSTGTQRAEVSLGTPPWHHHSDVQWAMCCHRWNGRFIRSNVTEINQDSFLTICWYTTGLDFTAQLPTVNCTLKYWSWFGGGGTSQTHPKPLFKQARIRHWPGTQVLWAQESYIIWHMQCHKINILFSPYRGTTKMSKCLRNCEENKKVDFFFNNSIQNLQTMGPAMEKPIIHSCCVNRSCRLLTTA